MVKIKDLLGKGILVLCLYIVCQFFAIEVFGASIDLGFIYAIAATILILYLYGNRKEK